MLKECGHVLEQNGYTIKILNLHDLSKTMRYNPFHYIESEDDIEYLALCMASSMANGKERSAGTGDTYWLEMAAILLKALIGAVYYEFPLKERNIVTLLSLFEMAGVERYGSQSDLTTWFQKVEKESKISYHVRNYRMFESQAGADRAQASCLGVVGSILAQWQLSSVRNLTLYDELDLYNIDDRKTALFVIYDDTDPSKNFISNILYSQLFKLLIRKAERTCEGRLQIPLRFYLDDFANTTIPGFVDMIATIRSREISACIILQSESQLTAKYGIDSDSIIENCATYLFTGTSGTRTAKAVAERFGMEVKEVLHLPKNQFMVYMDRQIRTNNKYRPENHVNYLPGYYDYAGAIQRERENHRELNLLFAEQINEYQNMLKVSKQIRDENRNGGGMKTEGGESDSRPRKNAAANRRQTPFDDQEEAMFYALLQDEIKNHPRVMVHPHVRLTELFEGDEPLEQMFCDFILRDTETLACICGIDVDGPKHRLGPEQIKRERQKEALFYQNGIRLVKVKPDEFYDEGWDIDVISAISRYYSGGK